MTGKELFGEINRLCCSKDTKGRIDLEICNVWRSLEIIAEYLIEKEGDEEKPDKSIVPLEPDTVTEGARIKCRR